MTFGLQKFNFSIFTGEKIPINLTIMKIKALI